VAHRLASLLEPAALRRADFITSVSEIQNEEMAARYPWLDRTRMAALPIGGDPEDFDLLRRVPSSSTLALGGDGCVELSYVGSYWPAAEMPVRAFLRGLARLRAIDPEAAGKLRVNFVGTGATFGARPQVTPLAQEAGVADLVREYPQRVPYLDALAVQAQSDGIVLIGSDEPHYTASKIYTSLMSGRPYLSLYHSASSSDAVLREAGGGVSLNFSSPEELLGMDNVIAEGLRRLAFSPHSLGRINRSAYAPYEARTIAARFAAIFDQVSERRMRAERDMCFG
jgi:hypothetical protein